MTQKNKGISFVFGIFSPKQTKKQAVFFPNLSKKTSIYLQKNIIFFYDNALKHFSYIVKIPDRESLVKKERKTTKISVKQQ